MTALSEKHIAFVGGGMMGEAIMRGLLRQELTTPDRITVSDPVQARRDLLSSELDVHTTDSNTKAVASADIVVLAIKPQALPKVLAEVGRIETGTLVLSIIAGARIATLRDGLACDAVVRIMPNTPGQVGEGISVWTATPETDESGLRLARAIVGALGEEIYVEDEDYLDMATAMSGSGPAYVFLFIEALTDAGVHLGFSRPIAEKLALQTVKGSAVFAQQRGLHPAVLRNMVTSPGGTTAEALFEFEKGAFRATVDRAVTAAYHRAQSLGKSKDE